MTKLVTWSNRDEDSKNANSLFQRRFLFRRRPRILRSLITRMIADRIGLHTVLLPLLIRAILKINWNEQHFGTR